MLLSVIFIDDDLLKCSLFSWMFLAELFLTNESVSRFPPESVLGSRHCSEGI